MDDLILIGAGGHAKACIDVIEQENKFRIAGLIDKQEKVGTILQGYSIIGSDDNLVDIVGKYKYAFVCIGQTRRSDLRQAIYYNLLSLGFEIPVVVSPHAYVSKSSKIGNGTVVMHGVIINADADVGDNCIINNNSLIEHDVLIKGHCHISTGAIINGHSVIGAGSLVGSAAVVNQCIEITENCIIGSNSLVTKSIMEPAIYVGNPVRRK